MTGGSAFYFDEQYRDLLLYLYRKLDENNSSNQQVHTAVQQYIQYTMVCSHVASNYVLSAVRHQGEELHGETYGRRNRPRNVYASLEVRMLGLGCLRTTTVVGKHGLDRFPGERNKMSNVTRK